MKRIVVALAGALMLGPCMADPLPSWHTSGSKTAIVDFVEAVTDKDADTFVPAGDRIAVFDNDGTLMSEQPMYFQAAYAMDRLRMKASGDPSILDSEVLKAANEGDMEGVMAGGMEGLSEILNVSHAGMTVEDFQADARKWLASTEHPTSGLTYSEMTFQPMVELLTYLRDEDFRVYIVTGGGVDFVRALAEDAYNVPPENVVGTLGNTEYQISENGSPTLMKTGGIFFVDDKAGKPVGIMRNIGKRPIMAVGNSDGDFQMLEWTTEGPGLRLGVLLHHTDGEREFAYDRESHFGKLADGLDQAGERGWVLIDMADDWETVWTGNQ